MTTTRHPGARHEPRNQPPRSPREPVRATILRCGGRGSPHLRGRDVRVLHAARHHDLPGRLRARHGALVVVDRVARRGGRLLREGVPPGPVRARRPSAHADRGPRPDVVLEALGLARDDHRDRRAAARRGHQPRRRQRLQPQLAAHRVVHRAALRGGQARAHHLARLDPHHQGPSAATSGSRCCCRSARSPARPSCSSCSATTSAPRSSSSPWCSARSSTRGCGCGSSPRLWRSSPWSASSPCSSATPGASRIESWLGGCTDPSPVLERVLSDRARLGGTRLGRGVRRGPRQLDGQVVVAAGGRQRLHLRDRRARSSVSSAPPSCCCSSCC